MLAFVILHQQVFVGLFRKAEQYPDSLQVHERAHPSHDRKEGFSRHYARNEHVGASKAPSCHRSAQLGV